MSARATSFGRETAAAARDMRAAAWREALEKHEGDQAAAAREMGFSRSRACQLTRDLGLRELRAELRSAAGQPLVGRPRLP